MTLRSCLAAVSAAVALAVGAAGCSQPAFGRASGIEFTTPPADQATEQPLRLGWEIDADLQARIDAGEVILGVFVDRTPLPPGGNLLDLADDDCLDEEGCPDAAWLADRGVYATKGSSIELRGLPDIRTSAREDADDRHEAVIVLLDASGTRLDEGYWTTTFLVDRTSR